MNAEQLEIKRLQAEVARLEVALQQEQDSRVFFDAQYSEGDQWSSEVEGVLGVGEYFDRGRVFGVGAAMFYPDEHFVAIPDSREDTPPGQSAYLRLSGDLALKLSGASPRKITNGEMVRLSLDPSRVAEAALNAPNEDIISVTPKSQVRAAALEYLKTHTPAEEVSP